MYITSYYRILASKASMYLMNFYLCVQLLIYYVRCHWCDTHQTTPRSMANR